MCGGQIMQGLELLVRTLGLILRDQFNFLLCEIQRETLSLLKVFSVSLREINQMWVREPSEKELYRELCTGH